MSGNDDNRLEIGVALEQALRMLVEAETEEASWVADRGFPEQSREGAHIELALRALVREEIDRDNAAKAERANRQNARRAAVDGRRKVEDMNNPPELWSISRVRSEVGMSTRVIGALVHFGEFPAPVAAGLNFAWVPADIRRWKANSAPVLIDHQEVLRRTGLGRNELLELIRDRDFPAPAHADSRSAEWLPGRVQAWIETKVLTSRAGNLEQGGGGGP